MNLLNFPLFFASILGAMILDNCFWISASPEYQDFKNNKFPLITRDGTFKNKFDYVLRGRIFSVIKNKRDIMPALISSAILTILW